MPSFFKERTMNLKRISSLLIVGVLFLGDVAGAPGKLPYAEDVYKYMRLLEKATPRVKVFSIGTTEEGREMIAVAVASEENLKKLQENRAKLAKLADPRTLQLNDAQADIIVAEAV